MLASLQSLEEGLSIMISSQQFDSRILKVPYECCYCNQAIGTLKYTLQKTVHKTSTRQNYHLEFSICEQCYRQFRRRLMIWVGLITLSSLSTMIIVTVLTFLVAAPHIIILITFFLELVSSVILYKQTRQSIMPVVLTAKGELKFHNRDFQRKFDMLNREQA
jgi:hypothetical protein